MKYYAVEFVYREDANVDATRPRHRQYLAGLRDEGKLIGAGPLVDGRASALLIYKAEDEQGCRGMIDNDPMQTEGVLKSYTVTEWNPATRAFDN